MIGYGTQEIKSLTSMIGKTITKLVWTFNTLDFFSKLKPISNYLLTGFHIKNKLSPKNVLIGETVLKIILSVYEQTFEI